MYDNYIKRDNSYKAYEAQLTKEINNALDQFIMGEETGKYINIYNMYHLMLQIGWEGYIGMTTEDIKCMSETLFCVGIYPDKLNEIYRSGWGSNNPDYDNGNGNLPSTGNDGIGHMQISGKGIDYPVNRIR